MQQELCASVDIPHELHPTRHRVIVSDASCKSYNSSGLCTSNNGTIYLVFPMPGMFSWAHQLIQLLRLYSFFMQELSKLNTLDVTQRAAMHQALTSRVALTQGPPGTGKTFMGVLMCDIIVRCTDQTILCVCYTNHALDQFLESLLDKGITDIVRMGGRSKSTRLEPYTMRELTGPKQSNGRSKAENWRWGALKDEMTALEVEIEGLLDRIAAHNMLVHGPSAQQKELQQQQRLHREEQDKKQLQRQTQTQLRASNYTNRQRGPEPPPPPPPPPPPKGAELQQWVTMGPHLQVEHPEEWKQLSVEGNPRTDFLFRRWLTGSKNQTPHSNNTLPTGSWQTAHGRGTSAFNNNKTSSSTKGSSSGSTAASKGSGSGVQGSLAGGAKGGGSKAGPSGFTTPAVSILTPLWKLNKLERLNLLHKWCEELVKVDCEQLAQLLQRADRLQLDLKSLDDWSREKVLAKARVIGCTTTGAAMFTDSLLQAKVCRSGLEGLERKHACLLTQ